MQESKKMTQEEALNNWRAVCAEVAAEEAADTSTDRLREVMQQAFKIYAKALPPSKRSKMPRIEDDDSFRRIGAKELEAYALLPKAARAKVKTQLDKIRPIIAEICDAKFAAENERKKRIAKAANAVPGPVSGGGSEWREVYRKSVTSGGFGNPAGPAAQAAMLRAHELRIIGYQVRVQECRYRFKKPGEPDPEKRPMFPSAFAVEAMTTEEGARVAPHQYAPVSDEDLWIAYRRGGLDVVQSDTVIVSSL